MLHLCQDARITPRIAAAASGIRSASAGCDGILKAIRGPRGGYELARERRLVSANDILHAAGSVEDTDERPAASEFVN